LLDLLPGDTLIFGVVCGGEGDTMPIVRRFLTEVVGTEHLAP
jgi:hypothetical protein